MRVINFSDAKIQLNQVVDQVIDDADFTVIVRRYAPSAVVMSLDTFNSLMETLHLMKSSERSRCWRFRTCRGSSKSRKEIRQLIN